MATITKARCSLIAGIENGHAFTPQSAGRGIEWDRDAIADSTVA